MGCKERANQIDLSPNVPVYLEMAVAHDANKLIVSVEKYEWPFGEYATAVAG